MSQGISSHSHWSSLHVIFNILMVLCKIVITSLLQLPEYSVKPSIYM